MKLLFGLSGNPPHLGHLNVIQQALGMLPLSPLEVIIVPVKKHPFGKQLNNFSIIFEIVTEFARDASDILNVKCAAIDLEGDIMAKNNIDTVYSVDMLKELQERYPDETIAMCFGPDNKDVFHTFKESQYLEDNAMVLFAKEREPIRSTLIREALENNELLSNGQSPYNYLTKNVKTLVQYHKDTLYPQETIA